MTYGMNGWNHDNDIIRRRDVMDSLVKEYNRRLSLGERDGLKLAWIEKAVNEVEPARPEQRKGTWRDWDGNLKTSGYCGVCSACGDDSEYLTDYCPNCGADMRETWEVSE